MNQELTAHFGKSDDVLGRRVDDLQYFRRRHVTPCIYMHTLYFRYHFVLKIRGKNKAVMPVFGRFGHQQL